MQTKGISRKHFKAKDLDITAMQIEKVLINDCLSVSKVS